MILVREDDGEISVRATAPGFGLDAAGLEFAARQLDQEDRFGPTGVASYGDLLFAPLRGVGQIIGFIVIRLSSFNGFASTTDRDAIVAALSVAVGAAVEREVLARKNVEADVWRRHEELYSALLSSISHDFRTPLSAIMGAVETLSISGDILTKSARADMLDMIREESERLNRYVSNLLDMTRLESGKLNPNLEPIDPADLMGTTVSRMRRALHGFKVVIDVAPDTPLVTADFILMEHVIANLIENAVKYAEGGDTIRISAVERDGRVELAVEDEGRGIPEEELGRIFDKFYRVRKRDSASAGTGLGLSICRGIVEAHGGSIRAESPVTDGRGTRIVIDLPAARRLEPMGTESDR
jgi:two-component system sensor histidine kinase KdpD